MSSSFHSSIDENEERKNVSYNHRILTASLLIKGHVIFAWPKNPLQFAILYILYIFYITFNKRKKWESGPRFPQTLVLPRFRWPGFENKSGPRAKKSGPKYFSVRTNSSMTQIKVGQTHFQISISGPKRKGRVALSVTYFPILLGTQLIYLLIFLILFLITLLIIKIPEYSF